MGRNNYRVLFRGNGNMLFYDKKKIVFESRNNPYHLDVGLGWYDPSTLVDKGNYGFAEIRNVYSVIPDKYYDIDFFANRGVPMRIFKGYYGGSVFLKEVYSSETYLRAYNKEGDIIVSEMAIFFKDKPYYMNSYYTRLHDAIDEWVDITEEIFEELMKSLASKKGSDDLLDSDSVINALVSLKKPIVFKRLSGVLLVQGFFETLAVWGTADKTNMAWLGRKLYCVDEKNITNQVIREIRKRKD